MNRSQSMGSRLGRSTVPYLDIKSSLLGLLERAYGCCNKGAGGGESRRMSSWDYSGM